MVVGMVVGNVNIDGHVNVAIKRKVVCRHGKTAE